tara:strand:+ start:57451 stop:57963 length:513 start_codon:yes stop_codon:yes gene_type:complete
MSDNAISQMQMLYIPEEDRVLFRVNSAEGKQFRLWLTRRYILLLLNILKNHSDGDPDVSIQATPEAKQAVQSFKREKAMEGANFQEKFKEEVEEMPLGDLVPLAYRLNYRQEGDILHLGIEPKAGQGINLSMNRDINASMTALIAAAAKKAEWQLRVSAEKPGNSSIVVN